MDDSVEERGRVLAWVKIGSWGLCFGGRGDGGRNCDLRFTSFVAVVGGSGFARRDGGVVDEVKEVLSIASDDGELLAVLADGVELVGEGRL